ncbi:MAG: hypothetical protein KJP23_31165 [Deltaproteobacteria bacterium]|nr:hypothetical protein [Deltaproteobacteria bacterium]
MLRISDFQKRLPCTLLLLVIFAGCSSLSQVQTQEIKPLKTRELPSGNGWWFARFRMHWPPDTKPIWYMDLYLAHQVILPKLEQNKPDINLWRFHRRAARDGSGRQFSFIFYSSPQTARHIFNALKTDPLVNNLKLGGVLDQYVYDDPTQITRPNIEDTGDKNWPASIQKTWPYYIMGASQMWLNLIAEIVSENLTDNPPASIAEIETFYQQVNETITNLWQKEGRHAFMHHLNALFEYEPLIYWEKRSMTF